MGPSPGKRDGLLVLNAGSSTLKFAVYLHHADGNLERRDRDVIDPVDPSAMHEAVDRALERAQAVLGDAALRAAGHRVVLGGLEHSRAVRIDAAELARLRALTPLAPLHQPRSLEPVDAIARRYPALVQVACFDTAFHRTVPTVAARYAVPRELAEAGARRYGFHGLSYEYIAGALRALDPQSARGRVIVAHLGSGASLCAMVDGRSVATTMGFSPLSGIVMATRPGDLDPALILWMQRTRGMDVDRVESLLYHECGLAGVSGISGDMRELLASSEPAAREAIELFVYRIVRESGSLASACGGLDAFVFTGGIGERAAAIRAGVAQGLAWLGMELDAAANTGGEPCISTRGSRIRCWTLPTDEEQVVATHTAELAFAAAA
jgi:acetate kinase